MRINVPDDAVREKRGAHWTDNRVETVPCAVEEGNFVDNKFSSIKYRCDGHDRQSCNGIQRGRQVEYAQTVQHSHRENCCIKVQPGGDGHTKQYADQIHIIKNTQIAGITVKFADFGFGSGRADKVRRAGGIGEEKEVRASNFICRPQFF